MTDQPPSSDERAARVWAAMQAFVTSQDRGRELREAFDFGRGLGRVVLLLKLTEGPLTLREIADSQGVDAPYATVIVDKLVSRGLAERTPHPDDNRRKLVTLTGAGWQAAALAREIMARPPAAITDLPPGDLAALDQILARLTVAPDPASAPAAPRSLPRAFPQRKFSAQEIFRSGNAIGNMGAAPGRAFKGTLTQAPRPVRPKDFTWVRPAVFPPRAGAGGSAGSCR